MKISKRKIIIILTTAVLLISGAFAYAQFFSNQDIHGKNAIKKAVLDSSIQCCAIEGNYPQNIDYLKEKYGLQIDEKKYIIVYEVIGSNVLPEVTVLEKGK